MIKWSCFFDMEKTKTIHFWLDIFRLINLIHFRPVYWLQFSFNLIFCKEKREKFKFNLKLKCEIDNWREKNPRNYKFYSITLILHNKFANCINGKKKYTFPNAWYFILGQFIHLFRF